MRNIARERGQEKDIKRKRARETEQENEGKRNRLKSRIKVGHSLDRRKEGKKNRAR